MGDRLVIIVLSIASIYELMNSGPEPVKELIVDRLIVRKGLIVSDTGMPWEMLDPAGNSLDDLGIEKTRPLDGDLLAGEVRRQESLERRRGKPVRLEFRLRRAAMFGSEFSA